jgi:hypothetical protein
VRSITALLDDVAGKIQLLVSERAFDTCSTSRERRVIAVGPRRGSSLAAAGRVA